MIYFVEAKTETVELSLVYQKRYNLHPKTILSWRNQRYFLSNSFTLKQHWRKNVQIQSYFWSVFSCIWTGYRKIRTRKNSVFSHFPRNNKHYGILAMIKGKRKLVKNSFNRKIWKYSPDWKKNSIMEENTFRANFFILPFEHLPVDFLLFRWNLIYTHK